MNKYKLGLLTGLLVTGLSVAGFAAQILGAGATFPYPLYSKMFSDYNKLTGIEVNYQSIGSGGGIRQILSRTVDFGASDGFMSQSDLEKAPDTLLHIPICMGAVVIAYTLPGISKQLKFTPDVIAAIYLGDITKWNDARIEKLNPGVELPDMPIVVIRRSDGSGTSFIFTDYLSKVSKTWAKEVGRGTSVSWPVGLGGKGNEGVAGLVKLTPGAIGYIELVYARQNKMDYGSVQNRSGLFVKPALDSIEAAAVVDIPADTRISLTDTKARFGYPISGFTWLLVYQDQKYGNHTLKDAKELVGLLNWMIKDGQAYAKPLDYAPLPKTASSKAAALIKSITYNGQPLM